MRPRPQAQGEGTSTIGSLESEERGSEVNTRVVGRQLCTRQSRLSAVGDRGAIHGPSPARGTQAK